jgi:N-acyl-D-aspartate/D-glutamate deacylase
MPTFMLTHWTRDRKRGPKMALERVVFRQSREAAMLYGLADRGLLAPGLRADINVIDYDGLSFDRAEVAFDFPAGGRRPVQRARGYRHTFVAGIEIVTDDSFTGAMPGKLVRGPQNPQ